MFNLLKNPFFGWFQVKTWKSDFRYTPIRHYEQTQVRKNLHLMSSRRKSSHVMQCKLHGSKIWKKCNLLSIISFPHFPSIWRFYFMILIYIPLWFYFLICPLYYKYFIIPLTIQSWRLKSITCQNRYFM